MVSESKVRQLALALPEVTEQDHHGFPSFRLRGKVLATLPGPGVLNAMVNADDVGAVLALFGDCCTELWWGKRLSGVQVQLAKADARQVQRLLQSVWERKAPKALVKAQPR